MKKKILRLMAATTLGLILTACGPSTTTTSSNQPEIAEGMRSDPYRQEEFLLGTYTRLSVYDEGKKAALTPAFAKMRELGDKITINESGSEIDAINEKAGIEPVVVSADVFGLVKTAKDYSVQSNGAFNLVIGAITQLWRIGFDDARKPSQAEIDEGIHALLRYRQLARSNDAVLTSTWQSYLDLDRTFTWSEKVDEALQQLNAKQVNRVVKKYLTIDGFSSALGADQSKQ